MIAVKCSQCGKQFQAKDGAAGKKVKCPNCEAPIQIPAAGGAAPAQMPVAQAPAAPAAVAQPPAGQVIVVQVPQQAAAGAGTIGPCQKSRLLTWVLGLLIAGVQYFYLGQIGKGIVFTCITVLVMDPLVLFTCGLGLVIAVPLNLLLLIDAHIIAGRLKTQAISPWKFF